MNAPQARVLFLTSAAFNKTTGGGITFTNLFAGWPKDALATVHNDTVPVTYETCDRYYRLSEREIHRWGWLRHIPLGKPADDATTSASIGARPGLAFRLLKTIKKWVFGDAIPETTELSSELESWIADFRPSVLYTILGSNAMMELAERIRVRFDLPLVVHIMDDWASVLYRGGLLSVIQRSKKNRLMQHLMDVATVRMAICDAMAIAYQERYGQPFVAFQNTIDIAAWNDYVKLPEVVGHPVRVAYIGSILPFAQLDSLEDICHAVQRLYDEGFAIRLEIYSPTFASSKYKDRLLVGAAVTLQDTIQDDALFFNTLQAVDVLVLPVNFDNYTVDYIRYSMPTKVPAYLAIGTPVLAYGPSEVAQITYAESAGWGLTVTQRSQTMLCEALRTLATDTALRIRLHQQARRTAHACHDSKAVRTRFQILLAEAGVTKAPYNAASRKSKKLEEKLNLR
jgi:hypothetical protein